MRIENIKRWQWVVIGAVIGLAVGWFLTDGMNFFWSKGGDALPPGAESSNQIKDWQFFRDLAETDVKGEPYAKDLRVYARSEGGHVVTERVPELDMTKNPPQPTGRTRMQWFRATAPFVPARSPYLNQLKLDNPTTQRASVVEFLDEVKKKNPKISYNRDTLSSGRWTKLIYTAGGIVVIGGIWPFLVQLLVRWGFGRPPEEAGYDLSKVKNRPTKDKAPTGPKVTDGDMAQLLALEAQLEESIKGTGDTIAPAVAAAGADGKTPEPEVKKLTATKLEVDAAAAAARQKENHEYVAKQDDFYPVERRVAPKKE